MRYHFPQEPQDQYTTAADGAEPCIYYIILALEKCHMEVK